MLHVNFKKDHLNYAVVNTYQFGNVNEAKRKSNTMFVVQKAEMFEDV